MQTGHAPEPINRAVFLDRDGVINVEKEYLHRVEDFEFLPGVPQALRFLHTLEPYGVAVDGFYVCPHHPDHGDGEHTLECSCRKPLPGMIEKAVSDFRIDPARSFLVGDKLSDIAAGRAAGCRCFLVRTGYGASVPVKAVPEDVKIVDDLPAAAEAIIREELPRG
jgi:D-glycero-D-manno-heptose 1,7-bisphosphate phosphatase